jgi:glycosyltransferase EpsF
MISAVSMTDNSKNISPQKLRVLQIISAPVMGGIENQLLFFLQRYNRDKFIVDVACSQSTEGVLRDKYLATGTRLILCKWSRYIIPYVWWMLLLLRRERYDVVHARMAEVSGAAILSAWLAGVPIRIASYHHTETQWRNPGFMNRQAVRILQWITRRWATNILSVSQACLDVYYPDWRQYPNQFQICYNGVNIEHFCKDVVPRGVRSELALPEDSLVVGCVGRFYKQKNHQTFVDIAERVSKQLANVYFLLVGDGVLRQQIEQEVRKRGLSNRFVFTGNRNDVARMLSAMDIFLMPSLFEGFGTVAIEAQLSGLPVVASDLPSIREALSPVMHKFCRQPYDVAGMTEQVMLFLTDPGLRSECGCKGREYVIKRFSIDRTVKQLESVYSSASHWAAVR